MYCTYILENSLTGKRYIGSTENLERRLKEHNRGNTRSTRYAEGQWSVMYTEQFATYGEARRRELVIKSYKGGEALKKLLTAGLVHR